MKTKLNRLFLVATLTLQIVSVCPAQERKPVGTYIQSHPVSPALRWECQANKKKGSVRVRSATQCEALGFKQLKKLQCNARKVTCDIISNTTSCTANSDNCFTRFPFEVKTKCVPPHFAVRKPGLPLTSNTRALCQLTGAPFDHPSPREPKNAATFRAE